ncbi:ty3-gypsy retrotransposon protein [Cucumis melo var. makuwa]|uniref:Ty3-gypsy retrotransposon protein n=1 Tax=Cucumis melo var. makuwa TaxID=1194695 RepID=A0A5D3DT86_CUCMM|nr:ty3-gypsy retrotransposon protein [Cucumis melo var. makuwa]
MFLRSTKPFSSFLGGFGVPSGELLQCFLKKRDKSMFASEELMEIENVLHSRTGSHAPRPCSPSEVCSPSLTLTGSYCSGNHCVNKSTESGDDMELKEDKICSTEKVATELDSRPLTDHVPKENLLSSTTVKDEPYDHVDDSNIYGKDMNNVFSNTVSIKSEATFPDEHYENKVDNMRLQDRMKFFSSRKDFGFTPLDYEHPKPSDPGCSILVSEPASLTNIKRRCKRKKTVTNSVETALEEDAPGLLQILVDKGVLVDEIKLYGETESDEDLDESFGEDIFGELEDVISRGLAEMMEVAQLVENREIFRSEANLNGFSGGKYPSQTAMNNKTGANYAASENKGNTIFPVRTITLRSSNSNKNRREGTSKRLPDAEFQAWKEKGLCFRWKEKYLADHKCKMKEQRELRMFVVVNDTEEYEIIEEEEIERKEINRLEVKEDNTTYVELSINSVVGLNDLGTIKVRGKLQGEDVVILIDCGATHNFVSEKLVKKLHIPTKETAHYGVILGSGAAVQGKGVCEDLQVQLKNWTVKEDFLPLELGGVDVILGMQWLYSLGVTTVDWKNLSLTFSFDGKQVSIKGDPSLTKARVSLKNMIKCWEEKDERFLIECRAIEVEGLCRNGCYMINMEAEKDSPIIAVLKQFEDVFEWPERLRPRRDIEHQIHLKKGTTPINVRPYHYGYHEKEEMEEL